MTLPYYHLIIDSDPELKEISHLNLEIISSDDFIFSICILENKIGYMKKYNIMNKAKEASLTPQDNYLFIYLWLFNNNRSYY